jgi:hypothetical protein
MNDDRVTEGVQAPTWILSLRERCEEFLVKSPDVRGDQIDPHVSYAWAMRVLHDPDLTVRALDVVLARAYLASCADRARVDVGSWLPDPTDMVKVLVFLAELDGWLQKVGELHPGL